MSVDTKRPKNYRRERDWKRVADSYRDDLANLILVGNRLARGQAKPEEWNEAVRAATAAEGPICIHQGSSEGGPAPDRAGATSTSAGRSLPAQPTPCGHTFFRSDCPNCGGV